MGYRKLERLTINGQTRLECKPTPSRRSFKLSRIISGFIIHFTFLDGDDGGGVGGDVGYADVGVDVGAGVGGGDA